jgi:hypothetical protein
MRRSGWGSAWVILPHDGAHCDKVFATSYESAIREAGFDVLVAPNQGQGAASARIETARRLFPRIFFNADTTEEGRDAIAWSTKSGRTMIGTSGAGRTTIGVRTPQTASASCAFTTTRGAAAPGKARDCFRRDNKACGNARRNKFTPLA